MKFILLRLHILNKKLIKGIKFCKINGFKAFFLKIWKLSKSLWDYRISYKKWIKVNEPGESELIIQRNSKKTFQNYPLISIVMPVFNTPEKVLRDTLDSVLHQTYTKWQLCIANGSPNAINTTRVLKNYAEKDQRVQFVNLKNNLGIAGNTNKAIDLSEGSFVAFLDHDDCLAPFALFEMVDAINSYPQADIFYSDEDLISSNGKNRYHPLFKSAFNLELLRCVNYMCHFLIIRKSIGDEIGWLREGFEGAQDFDLILRAVEKSQWIAHIPRILYHWRAVAGSTAQGIDSKPFAIKAGKLALEAHFKRLGKKTQIQQAKDLSNYRVTYTIPSTPRISIIIPNHNHEEDLQRCVSSILKKSNYLNYEIVIVENNSHKDEVFELYEELKKNACVRVMEYHHPFNYSRINNFSALSVNSEIILFLNNDTEVITQNWLERMLEYALQPEVGAVGAKLYYSDGNLQHGGIFLGNNSEVPGHSHKGARIYDPGYGNRLILPQNISAVTAACMMMRRKVFNQVTGFDERYELAFGDVDLCLKLREKGYLNVWTPYAELFHYESSTRGYEDTLEKKSRFKREIDYFHKKWKQYQELGDPYYNPNLVVGGRYDFSLAPKPAYLSVRCLPSHKLIN